MEDPLQSQRLKFAFESEKGLLGMDGFLFIFFKFPATWILFLWSGFIDFFSSALMHQSNNVDSRRCYQCVKFLVTLAQKYVHVTCIDTVYD